jgi:acyl-CoA synthetase (NDP forming)
MTERSGGDAASPDLILVTGAENDAYRLMNPRSIAIIGASSRPGSLAWWPLHLLQQCGFRGEVYPVNPNSPEINGVATYRSLADIGRPVDVAVIPLNTERTLPAIAECVAAGVGAAVLPTQGFSEVGAAGRAKEAELVRAARAGGLRVVGPNTDGVANVASGAVMSIQPLFEEGIAPGPVGVVAQSGATAASIMVRLKQEGIGVSLSASAGNEADLGLADYMSVMLQDPRIRMVVGFVEAVRRPQDFYRVAALAAELGKCIALLKVGRSAQGVRRASAHTGALAGSDQIYDAVFAKYGVIRVDELSDVVAVAKTFLGVGALSAPGLGFISGSGGQAGAAADKALVDGIPVPALTPDSEAAIDRLLEFGSGFNPCDLTGEIARKPELAAQVYEQFSKTPEIGAVVYLRKKLLGDVSPRSAGPLVEASRQPGATPVLVYAMDGFVDGVEAELYRAVGIPVFTSLSDINVAVGGLSRRSRALARLARQRDVAVPAPKPGWSLPGGVLDDATTKRLLQEYGLPVPTEAFATGVDEAVAAAERIGYPVAVKVASAQIAHKTEVGGVVLDVRDADQLRAAVEKVLANGAAALHGTRPDGVLIQEQVTGGVELIAGLKVDPDFGPFVLLGLGGITAELMKDTALRPAPVSVEEALEMLDQLQGSPLLTGYRNTPKGDIAALAAAVVNLSRLGWDHAERLAEADLNPIVVLPEGRGVRILDALVIGQA